MSERRSRAGEEKARPQNLGGGPSFREPAKIEERPSSCPAPRGQREWQRGADDERSQAGAPALPPCTTQRPSGSQAPASLKPARPAVFPGSVHPLAFDCLSGHMRMHVSACVHTC